MGGSTLTVEFLGERVTVVPGEVLTFGRAGDVVIDEANPYLHRILGRFWFHEGFWWLENRGSQIELDVDSESGVRLRLGVASPAAEPVLTPLTGGRYRIGFTAGSLRYELEARPQQRSLPAVDTPARTLGRETTQFGQVDLTADERALLNALAEPVLRDPSAGADSLPANREVAARLGWTVTKFNRKLDYLCLRLTRAGVRGLQGGRGSEAKNRRWRLVEHAVAARLVVVDDLGGGQR